MGASHSIECLFAKLVGIQRSPGSLSVSVSNRQTPSVFSYGESLDDWVAIRLDLALAIFNGNADEFAQTIFQQLKELEAAKPQDPTAAHQFGDAIHQAAPIRQETVEIWLRDDPGGVFSDDGTQADEGFEPFFDKACTRPIPLDDHQPVGDSMIYCSVHGITHHSEHAQRPEFAVGGRVTLEREPDNPVDPLAMKVVAHAGNTTFCAGYVPADLAHALVLSDEGVRGAGVVSKTFSRDNRRVGLRIVGGVGHKLLHIESVE